MSKFERILELGSTELPDCRFCPETQLTGVAKEFLFEHSHCVKSFVTNSARRHDPIAADRLLWRAQSFRHLHIRCRARRFLKSVMAMDY